MRSNASDARDYERFSGLDSRPPEVSRAMMRIMRNEYTQKRISYDKMSTIWRAMRGDKLAQQYVTIYDVADLRFRDTFGEFIDANRDIVQLYEEVTK